ncbi:MAG: TatD family hydrolase [Chitinispirillaceae bacterium]|nr:TatD family hydrolase [Chitinispirillaceae bacterium]
MLLFDSHCHLQDDRLTGRLEEIITRARAAGLTFMLCCGTQESDWDAVASLAGKYPEIIPAFGLHPWFVVNRSEKWLERLEFNLKEHPKAVLGEIGLDHALDQRNDEQQRCVFISQLKLARSLHRPVSIHCRKAWSDLMRILDQQCGLPHGGAIHSYSGPTDLIGRLERLNVHLSFSGSITYDRNRRGCSAAAAVSDNRLLIETDSPDIPPLGIGRGENEPAHIGRVAQRLATIRGTTMERIAGYTFSNGTRLFTMP